MAEYFSGGNVAQPGDTKRVLLAKMVGMLASGSASGSGVMAGTDDPPTATPAGGVVLYVNKNNGKVWFWNGSAWVALIA